MTKMMRPSQIYGRGNPIPVGRTKFYQDIVHREGAGEFIPGTSIPRLRLTRVSDRVTVAFEDEVFAIADAFRARRDAACSPSACPITDGLSIPEFLRRTQAGGER